MTEFMNWLRAELLRLQSFDWGSGSRKIYWLKDGVAKFSSYYPTSGLAATIGISEEEIPRVIDSPSVINELEGKSFTIGWGEANIVLTWLEPGIREWRTDITQSYHEEDGKYYSKSRIMQKIVYLDGRERIVKDTGDPKSICITEEAFREAMKQNGRNSDQQK
jgi:hypothetical protein